MSMHYRTCATGFFRLSWDHGSEAAHSISWEMYHVMNRGDRREAIFADDADRERWLQTLTEACEKTGWEVHAYCVMRNPFHLVIETPQHNLVAGMKWLLSPYCQDCGIDNTGQPLSPSEGAREKPPQLLV